MSADVHANRLSRLKSLSKLAGPATRNYDGGHKMSSHKRKRDKAQDQLRNRMRQRINGNVNSSTLIHSKRNSSVLDGNGDASLSPRMKHPSSMEVTPRDLQGNNFWRTQQDRYNTLTGIQPPIETNKQSNKLSSSQTVPLQELVDRVLHRKEQTLGIGSKVSPMTIRAYKPPVAPFAMQQNSHVKKIVKMKPIQRSDRDDKGPFVLVLQRNGDDETQSNRRGRRRDRLKASADVSTSDPGLKLNPVVTNQILPPVTDNKSTSDLKTWRPALDTVHQASVLPEAEDRSVTNYRLQLQHANKLAESRFEFQHQVGSNQTVEEMTMQTLNPLPPIQSVYQADESTTAESAEAVSNSDQQRTSNEQNVGRTSSKSEILNLKKAQKEAKRQKQVGSEECTLLRTRKRFTNKTKQFKSELERARQLSAIEEDRSSLSSARLRGSSGRKASFSSSSASSLNRIHEGSVSNSNVIQEVASESDSDSNESGRPIGLTRLHSSSHDSMPLAPPTSPSVDHDSQWGNSVIMNVDVTRSNLDDALSNESGDSSSMDDQKQSERTCGPESPLSGDDVTVPPQETQDDDAMIWVEGDLPFRGSAVEHQDSPSEHTR